MKHLARLSFAVLMVLGLSPMPLLAKKRKHASTQKLDKELEAFLCKWHLKGGLVALTKEDKLVYNKAFGYTQQGSKMQDGDVLKIASLSKPITAVGILKLVEDHKLALDEQVFGPSGILNEPQYSHIADPCLLDITVRHLLQHTAGWDREKSPEGDPMFNPFHISEAMGKTGPADAATVIAYMLGKPLDFAPGTQFAYSNLGYAVLGRIIEKRTGLSYAAYIRQAIFEPLGMQDMQLALDEAHSDDPGLPDFIHLEAMDSHGGWKASAQDLARFLVALSPNNPHALLADSSLKAMMEGSESNKHYGLGWWVNEAGNCWHTGCLNNCTAFMARLHSGVCAVVLINTRPQDPQYLAELDKVLWNGMKKVKTWPEKDLFKQHKHHGHHAQL